MPIFASAEPAFATAAGRFYKPDGTPAYTVIGVNGKERATTIRDARKLGLYGSVTTVIKSAAVPGRERWKAEQLLMSALTLPQMPEESEQSWVGRVWQDSIQQTIRAAERGTRIHAAIEKAYRGEDYDPEFAAHVNLVRAEVAKIFGAENWLSERSFAHPLGYGGKVDLHSPNALIDIKTKDGDLCDVKVYDEHKMQVAAYAQGLELNNPKCAILFVSRTQPTVKLELLKPEDVAHGAVMFKWLLFYWRAVNKI